MKIFVSSVRAGLEAERNAVTDTILELQQEPIGMEHFSASPDPPLEECLSRVEEADVLILILGPAYGSIHSGTGLSYTENEYRHAKKLGLDVIAFPVEDLDAKIGVANAPDVADIYTSVMRG
jgi:predicted TIM-barrel fold metal-dependent hydrolase